MNKWLRATFASLRNRNFRVYFVGQTISTIGTWTQKVAQAWLVLEVTGSPVALGVTAALQSLPTLVLGPWSGLIADRFDKRRILLFTQAASIVPALVLGILTAIGFVPLWALLLTATVLGVIESIDKPARQTIVVEMVGRDQLINAITLNNITINAGRLIGPALAGLLITWVGLPVSFFINALSFVAVLVSLMLLHTDLFERDVPIARAPGQVRAGFRYVRGRPVLFGPLLLLAITGLLAWEWTVTIPLFARDALDGDAQTVGWLFTAMGAGAIVGALLIASSLRASLVHLIAASLVFAAALLAISVAPSLLIALILLFVLGTAGVAYRATTSSLAQLRSSPEMRGRTMSLFVIAIGGTSPLGAPLLGWLCEVVGIRWTMAIGGAATAITAIAVYFYLRRSEEPTVEPMLPDPPGGPGRIA